MMLSLVTLKYRSFCTFVRLCFDNNNINFNVDITLNINCKIYNYFVKKYCYFIINFNFSISIMFYLLISMLLTCIIVCCFGVLNE